MIHEINDVEILELKSSPFKILSYNIEELNRIKYPYDIIINNETIIMGL